MPIYHLSTKPISRSKGQSAIACAAYRAGDKLMDEKYGIFHDYTRKGGVEHSEILLPENAPIWMADREKLWNHIERVEMRKDSRLARELEISLPRELTLNQNISLIREFVQLQFVSKGIVADFSIHVEKASDGEKQPHAHVMLTTREIIDCDFGRKNTILDKKESLLEWRKEWADCANKHLAFNGHDLRIDHRNFKDQGIDLEPQKKIGVSSSFYRNDSQIEHDDIARRNGERLLANPEIALKVLTNQQSTFTHQDIARVVNRYTIDADQFQLVYEKVKSSNELVFLGKDEKNRERFTTRELLRIESEMVGHAKELEKREGHGSYAIVYDLAIQHGLSSEQKHVLEHITSDGDLKCVVGYAGSGKSRLLGAARETWEKSGYRVLGATLSGIAAENLQASSGIDSRTIASRFYYWDKGEELLSSKDILIIDEAGMIDSRQMCKLLDEANERGAKVVLVGDPEQLQAIQAGAAYRAIIERVGQYVELTEIWRQSAQWQKDATVQFATHKTADAINHYADHNYVIEFDSQQKAKESLVDAWNDTRLSESDKTQLMLAYTRKDVSDLNQMARDIRKSLGEIDRDVLVQTAKGERQFAIGEQIYFLQNDRELGVKNGSLGTIIGIDNDVFTIQLIKDGISENQIVTFSTDQYNNLDYGYAATIHKSQGSTVDRAYVLASRYLDCHATYVAMTRHRENAELYWSREEFPNFDSMVVTLSREKNKEFSLDYPERDFAAFRGVASEGWPTFESYPLELGLKDDFVLDLFGHNNESSREEEKVKDNDWKNLLLTGVEDKKSVDVKELFAGRENLIENETKNIKENDLNGNKEIDL